MTAVRTLSSLPRPELRRRLGSSGIRLRVAPFVVHIRSPIPVVAEGLHALYADHEWLDDNDGFADFHVAVQPRRRWFRPLCVFEFDGFQPFTPLALGEAFAFLEWGLNWCVTGHCHTLLTIHSAVLEKNGRVLVMPAPPGSGKSTLCAALMLHGWRLLSDEMALLDPVSGRVVPAPRPVSLKNQSINVVRRLAPDAVMGPVAHDTMKGTVAHLRVSADSLARAHVSAPPAWVVFPRFEQAAPLSVEPRPKARALVELASNSFNHHVHGRAGFEALAHLVDRSQCFELRYGHLAEALAWFDALEAQA
ncbi:MAG: HprK-related kinase A [Hydrogenophaga sp.]|nr:HprK-related kinase A [Hydrogenophaga sp.]